MNRYQTRLGTPVLMTLALLPLAGGLSVPAAAADCGAPAILPIPDMRTHIGMSFTFTPKLDPATRNAQCPQPYPAYRWRAITDLIMKPLTAPNQWDGNILSWIPSPDQRGVHDYTYVYEEWASAESKSAGEVPRYTATKSFQFIVDDNTMTYPVWRDYRNEETTIPIQGRAYDMGFSSYTLDYGVMADNHTEPTRRVRIAGPVTTPVPATGRLADWDVSSLADGTLCTLYLTIAYGDGTSSTIENLVFIDRTLKWTKRVWAITNSVTAADLDDDGKAEILASPHNGFLHVWRSDGTLKFESTQPSGGAPHTGVSVGDVDGDGAPEIFKTGNEGPAAFSSSDMALKFRILVPSDQQCRTTPTLADIDGDGVREIVFGTRGMTNTYVVTGPARMYIYRVNRATGQPELLPGWPQPMTHYEFRASASVGDVDGDGRPDIVATNYDRAYAWHGDGTPLAGWAGGVLMPVISSKGLDNGSGGRASQSKPAIADLDRDGTPEVIIACNVFTATGALKAGWENKKAELLASPWPRLDLGGLSSAVGEMDGNPGNGLEVVYSHFAWHADGSLVAGFPIPLPPRITADGPGPDIGSAVLVDCHDLDHQDLIAGNRDELRNPGLIGFHVHPGEAPHTLEGYPKHLFGPVGDIAAPVVGDFDGDGLVDVVVGITDASYGGVVAMYPMPIANKDENTHWPMLGHDEQFTGRYSVPKPNRPTGLAVSLDGSNRPVLTWRDASQVEEGYVIERSFTGAPWSYQAIAETGANAMTYTDETVAGGTVSYRVRARRTDPTWHEEVVSVASNVGMVTTNVAPTVNAGPNRTITLPASASLDGTVSDDGLPGGTLTTTWSTVSGPGTVTFGNASAVDTTASFSLSGVYVLRLTASDGALASSDDVTVTVNPAPVLDTTPPSVALTSPANGALVPRNTTITLAASATDNVGVTKVAFYVNGTLKGTDTTSPYTYSWKTPGKAGKSATLQAKAYDAAGNVGSSAPVTVTTQ